MKAIKAEIKKAIPNPRFYGGILISWALAGLVVAQAWRDPLSFYLGKITLSFSLLYPLALFGPVGGIWGGTENIAEERMEGTLSTTLLRPLSRWEWYWGKAGFTLFYNLLWVFTPLLGMALLEKLCGEVSFRLLGGGVMVALYIGSFCFILSFLFSFLSSLGRTSSGSGNRSFFLDSRAPGRRRKCPDLSYHPSPFFFQHLFLTRIDWHQRSALLIGGYTGGGLLRALIFMRQEEK